jgi:hypothetical protein
MDMERKTHVRLLYLAFSMLFLQLIVSTFLFSKTSSDGGFWPFVFAIFAAVTIIYTAFVSWLIRVGRVVVLHASVSTMALSVCLVSLNNFARLFGQQGLVAVEQLGLVQLLGSQVTPYALYVFFAIVPVLSKLRQTEADHSC